MLVGLAGSAILAGMLAGAQLIPVLEFTGQSGRAADEGPHDIYPFSLDPARLAEFVWPSVFGTNFDGNRHWLTALPPTYGRAKAWVPSLYLGGLTILLALGAMGFRGGPPWRSWLTAIAVVTLLAAMGEYTSPIYWARWVPACARAIGPHDPVDVASIRFDGYLRDGDGGVYWFLATVLPGFRQFRYPSKLLSFTVLALAALAGIGWERVTSGRARRAAYLASGLLIVTLAALAIASIYRGRILEAFQAANRPETASSFGPMDPAGAFAELRRSLAHAAIVMAVGLALTLRGSRRVRLAGAVALIAVTADLGLANARYVLTAPQAMFETIPKVVQLIRDAERERSRPGALSDPPDADLEPHGLASGVVRRSGARLPRLGTRHPPAEIRPPLRRPVHADPRRRRALRLRVLLRGLLPDGRRRDGQAYEAARRQEPGGLPPEAELRPLEHALLRAAGLPGRLGARAPGLCVVPAGDRGDLPQGRRLHRPGWQGAAEAVVGARGLPDPPEQGRLPTRLGRPPGALPRSDRRPGTEGAPGADGGDHLPGRCVLE